MATATATVTFMKLRNGTWGLRVPHAVNVGDLVTVAKRDGSTAKVEIDGVVWTDGKSAICSFCKPSTATATTAIPVTLAPIPTPATSTPATSTTSATSATFATATPRPLGKAARIDAAFSRDMFVATSCACCGRPLTDPNSIESGMGPICRRDHGFDVQDEPAKWEACFATLGAMFPVDTYEQIIERHDHFIKADLDDQGLPLPRR